MLLWRSASSATLPSFQPETFEKYPVTLVMPSTYLELHRGQRSTSPRMTRWHVLQVVNSGENAICAFPVLVKVLLTKLATECLSGRLSAIQTWESAPA